jgi:hypothetical protein
MKMIWHMVVDMLLKEAAMAVPAMVSRQPLEDSTLGPRNTKSTEVTAKIEASTAARRRLLIATKLLCFAFLWVLVMGFGSDRFCEFILV